MNDTHIPHKPELYEAIATKSKAIGFTMPSDLYIGSLLKTLVASKPGGHFLELGTGMGFSLCWMLDGMDATATLITIDNDPELIAIAKDYFGQDARVNICCEDGTKWLDNYEGKPFDLVFADAWPGKYSDLETLLALIPVGGFYIIDDMSVQPNWPEGHEQNAEKLVHYLEQRTDLTITKLNWSTGLIVAVKTKATQVSAS